MTITIARVSTHVLGMAELVYDKHDGYMVRTRDPDGIEDTFYASDEKNAHRRFRRIAKELLHDVSRGVAMRIEDWMKVAEVRVDTPWGLSDTMPKRIAKGVYSVSTPSHGGIWVSPEFIERIPLQHRQWAAQWSGSFNWFEEDLCWAAVAVAFPQCFAAQALHSAEKIIAQYFPKESHENNQPVERGSESNPL